MKRTLYILLAAALLLSVCGCAHAGGQSAQQGGFSSIEKPIRTPPPAPLDELPAPDDAPAPDSEPAPDDTPAPDAETPTPAPAEETPLPVTEDGPFPGGLDDDGPGDLWGPQAVASVELTPDVQYRINLFLSNFAEQYFRDYSYFDINAAARAVDFAHIWCKVNASGRIEYANANGSSYETLTMSQVENVVSRYFPMKLSDYAFPDAYPPSDYSFYRDGKFWFLAADGEAWNRIAVADSMTLLEDGTYSVHFSVYALSITEYFDYGVDRGYYRLSAADASEMFSLTRILYGSAVVEPGTWAGEDTYKLLDYHTWE